MPYPIRIMLVDDHELILESWKLLFEQDDRFLVVAQCNDGSEAIEFAGKLAPDVVLMDINMSPVNGFEATEKITALNPDIKIIGVSANDNLRYAIKLLSLGGKGFVTKTSAFDELKTAILTVYEGENYLCREIQKKSGN